MQRQIPTTPNEELTDHCNTPVRLTVVYWPVPLHREGNRYHRERHVFSKPQEREIQNLEVCGPQATLHKVSCISWHSFLPLKSFQLSSPNPKLPVNFYFFSKPCNLNLLCVLCADGMIKKRILRPKKSFWSLFQPGIQYTRYFNSRYQLCQILCLPLSGNSFT